jgi:alkylation response protein AidB-like acyl-CoA dehydrogenase
VDFAPTPEQEKVRALARRVAESIVAPAARRADEERRFDRSVIQAVAREGILGGPIPRDYGGGGWDDVSFVLCCEELGRVDASVRGFVCVHVGLVARSILDHGTEEQRRRWLPGLATGERLGAYALTEEGAGSDAAAIATRAREEGDTFVLDGEKIWTTNGGVADLLIVYATVDPALGRKGITAFVVDGRAAGIERLKMPGVELGHRGADHARLVLKGVRVPREDVLGPVGGGYAVAMQALEHGRLGVAAGAVGIHAACLDLVIEFARKRRQFGKRIGDFQMVQERIADMAAELEASRLLVLRAAWTRAQGERGPGPVAAAKLFAAEAAQRAASEAVLLLGSRGYSSESPVERHYRDVQGLRIYEGTSHIQRIVLARDLLGKDGPVAKPSRAAAPRAGSPRKGGR